VLHRIWLVVFAFTSASATVRSIIGTVAGLPAYPKSALSF
jgi:hypothetical protein